MAARPRFEPKAGRAEDVEQHRDLSGPQPLKVFAERALVRPIRMIEAIIALHVRRPDHAFSQSGEVDALQDGGSLA